MDKKKTYIGTELTPIVSEVRSIIEQGRKQAYAEVAKKAIITYWKVGRRLVEEEQNGDNRATYGTSLVKNIANELVPIYGNSYNKRNLDYYKRFYILFPDMQIVNTRVHNLNWSHIRRLLSVTDAQARLWYLETADRDMWSVRTLDRNISSQYYGRRLAAQCDDTATLPKLADQTDPMEYIKNPMVAEFMGFRKDTNYNETDLEQTLIDNLEKFILELGRGFAFVERQQHIVTDTDDFYVDLVFYNYRMKRFVIFELKTHKLTHQDIGQ